MKVAEIVEALERIAPPRGAEEWDNVGLLVGDAAADVRKIMLCVDLTPRVLAEAVRIRAQMVLAYHPVIFKGLSRLTADAEPVVYQAVRRGIAVYALHTAFDVVPGGTNDVLAAAMGLTETAPLRPTVIDDECKIVTFVPPDDLSSVAHAAFTVGAGQIGSYVDCAFFSHGIGTFCGSADTHPTVGHPGHHETAEEMRLEMVAPKSRAAAVCQAIRTAHSYETPAIDVYPLTNSPSGQGMGRVGSFGRPVSVETLIARVKKATGLKHVLVARATAGSAKLPPAGGPKRSRPVTTAACGAGSCGSLFRSALAAGATFYLTGEMRHHDVLAAAGGGMTVVCLGHSNSERIALHGLLETLTRPLKQVKLALSKLDADPLDIV